MNKNIIIGILAVVVIGVAGYYFLVNKQTPILPTQNITNFEECVDAGYAIMESYPRQCAVSGGSSFTEDIGNAIEKQDLIQVENPQPGDVVSSPLKIKGHARGTWYFEASFPVKLFDANNNEIQLTPSYIMTANNWMTEDFVPFEATVTYAQPATAAGTLILHKDNPSDLPENDDQLVIPVRFSN